jgi:hypothetical protein
MAPRQHFLSLFADMALKSLEKFCVKAAIGGYSRKTKKEMANLIVAWRLNNATLPGLSTGNTAAAAAARGSSAAACRQGIEKRKAANYGHLINCLFHPTIRPLYAKFKQQPDKNTLDSGKKHNQVLCEKVLVLYNSADSFDDSDDDDNSKDDEGEDHNIGIQLKFHDALPTSAIKPSPFNKMDDWGQVLKSIQTLHKHFMEVQTEWKKSGEHRAVGDVVTAMGKDIVKDRTFTVNKPIILYYILFLEKDPQIFASAIDFCHRMLFLILERHGPKGATVALQVPLTARLEEEEVEEEATRINLLPHLPMPWRVWPILLVLGRSRNMVMLRPVASRK